MKPIILMLTFMFAIVFAATYAIYPEVFPWTKDKVQLETIQVQPQVELRKIGSPTFKECTVEVHPDTYNHLVEMGIEEWIAACEQAMRDKK